MVPKSAGESLEKAMLHGEGISRFLALVWKCQWPFFNPTALTQKKTLGGWLMLVKLLQVYTWCESGFYCHAFGPFCEIRGHCPVRNCAIGGWNPFLVIAWVTLRMALWILSGHDQLFSMSFGEILLLVKAVQSFCGNYQLYLWPRNCCDFSEVLQGCKWLCAPDNYVDSFTLFVKRTGDHWWSPRQIMFTQCSLDSHLRFVLRSCSDHKLLSWICPVFSPFFRSQGVALLTKTTNSRHIRGVPLGDGCGHYPWGVILVCLDSQGGSSRALSSPQGTAMLHLCCVLHIFVELSLQSHWYFP